MIGTCMLFWTVQMFKYSCSDGIDQRGIHHIGNLRFQRSVLLPVVVNGVVIINSGTVECCPLFMMQGDWYNVVPPAQVKVQVEWFHNTKYKKVVS